MCCLKSIAIVQSKTLTMHPAKAVANLTCIMCIILELIDFNWTFQIFQSQHPYYLKTSSGKALKTYN